MIKSMRIAVKEIEIATEGTVVSENCTGYVSCISTDTRKDCYNSLFIPIIGPNFDAHNYINNAFEKGAAVTLTDRDVDIEERFRDRVVIKVGDTLKAMGMLASVYRLKFSPNVVGITGSAGKTTTKDLVALVLSKKYNVLKTPGNFNNEIGLPLTVFRLDESYDSLVLEMGMNSPGEISRLSKIGRPDSAIITNIGLAHVEKLGSKQNILKAKLEIIDGLSKNGTMFLNGDDTLLSGLRGLIDRQIVYFGIDENLDVIASDIKLNGDEGVEFEFQWQQRSYKVNVHIAGAHNVHNALAAVAVGLQNGVKPEDIVEAIGEYRPGNMRMNIVPIGGIKIIDDTYNANPQSMYVAIDAAMGVDCGDGDDIGVGVGVGGSSSGWSDSDGRGGGGGRSSSGGVSGSGSGSDGNISDNSAYYGVDGNSDLSGNRRKKSSIGGRRIAVFGEMYELGDMTERCHFDVGEYAASHGIDILLALGGHAQYYVEGASLCKERKCEAYAFSGKDELIGFLADIVMDGDLLLVKGSRGAKMEEVVDGFKERIQKKRTRQKM
ncbi:MAG: UDP-N-acetylmuramoyl-tripeptide--D-alanyl-D-alanine ligase [Synergistaceae bacterium]|nr:UDP-N-acetylmuramoyl-tripeptide--D-alanyl-D-alanine ligase [Synergistaceae bacterium]